MPITAETRLLQRTSNSETSSVASSQKPSAPSTPLFGAPYMESANGSNVVPGSTLFGAAAAGVIVGNQGSPGRSGECAPGSSISPSAVSPTTRSPNGSFAGSTSSSVGSKGLCASFARVILAAVRDFIHKWFGKSFLSDAEKTLRGDLRALYRTVCSNVTPDVVSRGELLQFYKDHCDYFDSLVGAEDKVLLFAIMLKLTPEAERGGFKDFLGINQTTSSQNVAQRKSDQPAGGVRTVHGRATASDAASTVSRVSTRDSSQSVAQQKTPDPMQNISSATILKVFRNLDPESNTNTALENEANRQATCGATAELCRAVIHKDYAYDIVNSIMNDKSLGGEFCRTRDAMMVLYHRDKGSAHQPVLAQIAIRCDCKPSVVALVQERHPELAVNNNNCRSQAGPRPQEIPELGAILAVDSTIPVVDLVIMLRWRCKCDAVSVMKALKHNKVAGIEQSENAIKVLLAAGYKESDIPCALMDEVMKSVEASARYRVRGDDVPDIQLLAHEQVEYQRLCREDGKAALKNIGLKEVQADALISARYSQPQKLQHVLQRIDPNTGFVRDHSAGVTTTAVQPRKSPTKVKFLGDGEVAAQQVKVYSPGNEVMTPERAALHLSAFGGSGSAAPTKGMIKQSAKVEVPRDMVADISVVAAFATANVEQSAIAASDFRTDYDYAAAQRRRRQEIIAERHRQDAVLRRMQIKIR